MGNVPILVLGLGNLLLEDEAAGLAILEQTQDLLRRRHLYSGDLIEFLDGGTQGLALLDRLAGRETLLILDAVDAGLGAGSVVEIDRAETASYGRATTAHESNAGELLAVARLLGQSPMRVRVIGVQPASFRTRIGLSEEVAAAIPEAAARAAAFLEEVCDVSGRARLVS